MHFSRTLSITAMLAVCLLGQSCFFKKSPRKATIIVPPSPQPPPPQPLPAPPNLPPTQSGPTIKSDSQVPTLPAPVEEPAKKRPRPPKRPPAGSAASQQAPVEHTEPAEPAAVPAPAVPALQPILAPKETTERNRRISAYLDKARVNVYRAERRKPDAQTAALLSQVKTFLQQAEEARKIDLVRAENLAERAEVLSRGLNR